MRPGDGQPVREHHHRLGRDAYQGEVVVAFTACTARRRPVFLNAGVVRPCVDMANDAARDHGASVLLYCFMPDHVHLVLRGDDPQSDVWRGMVSFKQQTAYWLKRHARGSGWQKDFFDRIVRKGDDLPALRRYIANNPVRAGLARDWREYPFLGSQAYALEDLIPAA